MWVTTRHHQVPVLFLHNGSLNWFRSRSDDSFVRDCYVFYFPYLCCLVYNQYDIDCRFLVHFTHHSSLKNFCFVTTLLDWSRSIFDDIFVRSCLVFVCSCLVLYYFSWFWIIFVSIRYFWLVCQFSLFFSLSNIFFKHYIKLMLKIWSLLRSMPTHRIMKIVITQTWTYW